MRIAVEGCSHGELDAIYASILKTEQETGLSTDLVLLCGDFQAIRNVADLKCLAVPEKYRALGQFHKYYSGAVVAPILTLVIGGNHEASNYMWELFHGGWIAPNIYYLGAAGCVDVGGLIIAGASGIWKGYDYRLGRFERMPYDKSDIRSCYHTRLYDIQRLKMLAADQASLPHIVLSHDWPNTIEQAGDTDWLKRAKPFFTDEINTSTLGSPALLDLLTTLRPPFWFAAHLHVRFAALWRHDLAKQLGAPKRKERSDQAKSNSVQDTLDSDAVADPTPDNLEAIDLDDVNFDDEPPAANPEVMDIDDPDEEEVDEEPKGSCADETAAVEPPPDDSNLKAASVDIQAMEKRRETRFLALSKALPKQDFLQLLDVPAPSDEERDLSRNSVPALSTIPTGPSAEKSLPPRYFPTLRFVSRWLAITRAMHPYLCLEKKQNPPLPSFEDPQSSMRMKKEEEWVNGRISEEQASIDAFLREEEERKKKNQTSDGDAKAEETMPVHLRRKPHPLDVGRVQSFVRTAPGPNEPGGQEIGPPPWYTNPQTVALCAFLDIPNRINPAPLAPQAPPPSAIPIMNDGDLRRKREEQEVEEIRRTAEARKKARAAQLAQQEEKRAVGSENVSAAE